jgi:hypothetical protein
MDFSDELRGNVKFYRRKDIMQIALTAKLSKALGMKPPATDENVNPLFTWTANWTKRYKMQSEIH